VKIRALVVDDEPLLRSNVTTLLGRDEEIDIIGECGTGIEALAETRRLRPDLLFLDVEMPECDGFDVVEMLGADVPPVLVFVTAYDRYAIRAFDSGAVDYLLKPFDNARFTRTLERAKDRLRHGAARRTNDALAIKSGGGLLLLKFAEIDWIEAADYKSCVHSGSSSHPVRRSMNDLERGLDARFCRVHRSAIVNLHRVRGVEPSEHGEYDVILSDGTRLPSSRRYRKELLARLDDPMATGG